MRAPTLSLLLLLLAGCAASHDAVVTPDAGSTPDAGTPGPTELRVPDRSLVEWLASSPDEPWWIEERLAPQPAVAGDRDLGPRAIVRAAPEREVVWLPPESDRMTDACRHPSGEWSAVGVDDDERVFLARGDRSGLIERVLLDDPELAGDARAWMEESREVPRIGALSEASPTIVADGEDVVVALTTEDFAVLVYRWRREGDAFVRGPRTLVSPAMIVTPFLPIGGSFDDFDSMVAPYQPRLAIDGEGRAYVAIFADRPRLLRHDAVLGTTHDLLRDQLHARENTLDALVTRIDRDGSIGWSTVAGTVDYEDEIFGIAAGDTRVAVLGRRRRELGRDNTELHAVVIELSLEGARRDVTTIDGADSALAQTAAYAGEDLWVGGTEGWTQNPSGRSVFTPGTPFLVRLRDGDEGREIERIDALVPETSGHAELRALQLSDGVLSLGGHENAPLTHTADGDRSLVRSDAWAVLVEAP